MSSHSRWITVLALGLCTGIVGDGPAIAATGTPLPSADSAPSTHAKQRLAASVAPTRPAPKAGTRSAGPASSSASPGGGPSLGEEEKFWTADRMDNAVPVDAVPGHSPVAAAPRNRVRNAAPPGTPAPEHFDGHPMVGTFFYDGRPLGGKSTYCTGSVVHTAAQDIVLTAGHCGRGLETATHRIFVPQYRSGQSAAQQPHGVFPVSRLYIDPRYAANTKDPTSDLDLAFAQVDPNSRGEVEAVTGALTFTPASNYTHQVTVIGYPGSDSVNPKHQAIRCPVTTSRLPGFRQIRMTCKGFYGGVSGGPWIEGYNRTTGTGNVIGNTGGYFGGGDDANDDWVTYAPVYGKDAQDLFADAAAHRTVGPRPPYQPSTDGPALPGSASTWQHAKLLASGDFRHTGHSDMIVVWTDGKVTLYPGDGQGGFGSGQQLLAANGTWTHAETITAGDFTGSSQFDLMVRWSDGEVTLFGDVGSKGLHQAGTRMIGPNDTWKNATQITAGRFGAGQYVTDLMVRWSNGELTLYTNVGAGTFGQKHRLKEPNGTWKNATLLTGGEFSGNQKWDLMVRWSDGELDDYVGTTTSALGTERRLLDANEPWTHGVAMTTGDYTGNGRTDDLVVRRSDGETTMYTDTGVTRLGDEHTLVTPAS
ncbi:trypsin-like serine peptidase [Streptomyces griseochromogenes]|uniref:trypsin-like serine peptidase n=1 Tax=Streptomyces griseochromogenes TaxID=68214 RepID=UPI00379DA467